MKTGDVLLMASAGSLEQLAATVRQRWGWSVCNFHPTDDPKRWTVERYDGIAPDQRVRLVRGRYRLEAVYP